MANPTEQSHVPTTTKAQFEALSKNAVLEILLPRSPDFDASGALQRGSLLQELERLPSRRNLFFDESADITVILKTEANEALVRTLLPSVEITLAAHVTDAVPQGSGNAASASGKHDLTSKTFPGSETTKIVRVNDGTFIIWNPVLSLTRPRAKVQRPAVYFTVYLTVAADALAPTGQDGKVYLNSLEPLPVNVLEPLQFTPALINTNVFLSETRLTKVAPPTNRQYEVKPIRNASRRAWPIIPALFARIRYSALPDSAIASLHLETSHVVTGMVQIQQVSITTLDAGITALNAPSLPLQTQPGDETILLSRLIPKPRPIVPANLAITISATVIQDHSIPISLHLTWTAQVDLSAISSKPVYKWSRPLSSANSIRPSARPSIQGDSKAENALPPPTPTTVNPIQNEAGITFNIWTPSIIPPRIDFKLHIQCINRSSRARRFALVIIEPKKRSMKLDTLTKPEPLANDAPLQTQRPPDVFDINPDVRIGPLPPGATYETELKFWATTTGVLDLGIVRIVDLDTRQTIDVRELPDVIVLGPGEG